MLIPRKISRINQLVLVCLIICLLSTIIQNNGSTTSPITYNNPPTGFSTWSKVNLRMDYEYKIWSLSNNNFVEMWFHRFSNHSHPHMIGVAPIQSVDVLSNTTNFTPDTYYYDPADDYNNTIEFFDVTLLTGNEFIYEISYNITMNEITWEPQDSNEQEYNLTDPFYLNLTGPENNLQVNNPTLVDLSNQLCEGKTSIGDKIEAILDWIINNIEYEPDLVSSQGAYLTYFTKRGDCSDFSTLFVTLCRIQGIPARKIVGLVLFDDNGYPLYNLKAGDEISYFLGLNPEGGGEGNVPGHAWAEYYIPGYGFISTDPTFCQSDKRKYMNSIDYIHLFSSVGENFGAGIDPPLPSSTVEFGFLPYIISSDLNNLRWSVRIDIEIISADLKTPRRWIPFHTGVLIVVSLGTISLLGLGTTLKSKIKPHF